MKEYIFSERVGRAEVITVLYGDVDTARRAQAHREAKHRAYQLDTEEDFWERFRK